MTDRTQLFIREFLVDHNGAAAAIRAGYAPKSAKHRAHKLLRKRAVRDAIRELSAQQLARAELSAASVLEQARRLLFFDIGLCYDAKGNALPIHRIPADTRAAIIGAETIIKNAQAGDGVTDTVLKLKVEGKARVLEVLMKHFGLVTERVEVIDADRLIKRIAGTRARLAAARKALTP